MRRWRYTGGTWRAAAFRTTAYLARSLELYISCMFFTERIRLEILEGNLDNWHHSSAWLIRLPTMQYLSHKPAHKKLNSGGPDQDDCLTPLLSSSMSSDDKITKAAQEVVVAVVDEEASSTRSRNIDAPVAMSGREPWWSYIWVSFSNIPS